MHSLEVCTLGRVTALWAGGGAPGDVLCQGMVFSQGTGYKRLQPGKGMSSCEYWGFSVSAPAKSKYHCKCLTQEHKVYVSYGAEIQPPCSGTDTWKGNGLARIWRWALDQCGVWHSSPRALQHDLQFWLTLLNHGRKGSPGERVSGTSWKSGPPRVWQGDYLEIKGPNLPITFEV